MPELPEVETIARNLREGTAGCFALLGRVISGYRLYWPRTLAKPGIEELNDILPGEVIHTISRRGKFLVIGCGHVDLVIHLRMSGDIETVMGEPATRFRHIRFTLEFEDGGRMLFNDPRKFGRIWVVQDPIEVTGSLGPEPLDTNLTAEGFYGMLHSRKRAIKPLLMDQSFIAGLGNIYTDEALHLAGIHPLRISNGISGGEAGGLLKAIRAVLQDGIQRNGASIDWVYRGGDYQNNFRVYGRQGQACGVCGTMIERLVVGQRGTHICPRCQPRG